MPSEAGPHVGVKIAAVAPGNPRIGLPRVQALYLLLDAETLAISAILDGAALTTLRTPAVSVAAIRPALPARPLNVVVYGRGPQAAAHVDTLAAVAELACVTVVGRGDDPGSALGAADVIVCATTATEPLFESRRVKDDAIVIAVGSHEPDVRELDSALMARSQVIVEDVATALREAGDVVQAVAGGALVETDLVSMRAVVTGAVAPATDRPVCFKSSGMAWEDLAVASAAARAG
jgi:ornithine cyclodeaminase